MVMITTVIILIVLSLLTIFQLALIFKAPLGRYAWGGQHTVLPTKLRIGSVGSILIYAIFALLALSKAGLIDIISNQAVLTVGLWVTFGYLALGVIVNLISRSRPERLVMTPVALVLAISFFILAIN